MSKRLAVRVGRTMLVPLVLWCGAAGAGSLLAAPSSALTTAPSLAALPSAVSSLPAAGLAVVPGSLSVLGAQSPALLPGLEGIADHASKESAMHAGTGGSGIRPIRVPGIITIPISFPGLPGL